MSGLRSRRKGAQYERELARLFSEAMPGAEIRRGIQNRTGGDAADVEGTGVWHVEAKRGKLPNPRAALKQAIRDAKPGKIPIAVIRDDRSEAFTVLRLSDFLQFVSEHWRLTGGGNSDTPAGA